ncbi:chemotaxis response regulator protein-glutamate methylesterase [candidate division WOR-3 bacterium]|nr:chemotaxis response regulator protein-glutamate methylesterase [candidate division WOR-3 bacterium]
MIRVLVVDDSLFIRSLLTDILESEKDIDVIDTAKDGIEAISKTLNFRPDVITMDVEMPRLNGIKTVEKIMKERPTPIIMISAYTKRNAEITLEALSKGAIDFITKPGGPVSSDIGKLKNDIITKVKIAYRANITSLNIKPTRDVVPGSEKRTFKIVVIASSTGGPKALSHIIPRLPKDFAGSILVIQHMPMGFTGPLAERLDRVSNVKVLEGKNGTNVRPGTVYIAPAGFHMKVDSKLTIFLTKDPPLHGVRPSADVTMMDVARLMQKNSIGVILTGMGRDGSMGVKQIKKMGGKVIVQDKETSTVYGMPKSALSTITPDIISPLDNIAEEVIRFIEND